MAQLVVDFSAKQACIRINDLMGKERLNRGLDVSLLDGRIAPPTFEKVAEFFKLQHAKPPFPRDEQRSRGTRSIHCRIVLA